MFPLELALHKLINRQEITMAEDRQIHAMIEFIERDAQEKAREFDDEAQALYDAEKAALVEQQKKKVKKT